MAKSNLSIKKKHTLAEARDMQEWKTPRARGVREPLSNKAVAEQKAEKKKKKKFEAEREAAKAAKKRRATPGTKEFKEMEEEVKDFHAYKRFLEAKKAADAKAKAKLMREQEKKKKTSPVKPGKKLKLKPKKPGEAEA
tara:strand:- start:141 stop:554 length:414 start_codon:yes stop_codon:yes gene_type:complete